MSQVRGVYGGCKGRMKIDKKKLKIGIWYTDEEGSTVPCGEFERSHKRATHAHICFPLEVREEVYKLDESGDYGGKDRVLTITNHIGKDGGRLAVAMVNSGDYDLGEALGVLAMCCERCLNVLYNKYLPEVGDGYLEYSEEWKKCKTVCEFCKDGR